MKLHLPIALLAAIVSSQFAVAASTTQASANASGVTFDNSNPGHANVTISANAGDLSGYYMYGYYRGPAGPGVVGVASQQVTSGNAPYEKFDGATITMNGGTGLVYLAGYGIQGNAVAGDTTINMNGGSVKYIIGGTHYESGSNRDKGGHDDWDVEQRYDIAGDKSSYYKSNYGEENNPEAIKQNITINVNDGSVGHIRGTHNGHSNSNIYKVYLPQVIADGETAIKDFYDHNPVAVGGDVTVNVNGGEINAKSVGEDAAILGGGGTGFSVDGTVKVNVTGGSIVGDILAGSSGDFTFVGATDVNISGGSIKGNVYGGSDGTIEKLGGNALGYGAQVKGDTKVVLSGGTIEGHVYAAGKGDTVNGGTNVVIKNGGTKVTGIISGMGVDSEVNGERLLSIENSGGLNVGWDQFEGFNSLKIDSSQINFGTLSDDFTTVTTTGTGTHVQGTIAHDVLLKSDGSWLQLDGSLSTTAGSSITDTMAGHNMSVKENATFKGTTIENSTIVAGGDMWLKNDTGVTNSHLSAGNIGISGSTMEGGTLTTSGVVQLENNASVTTEGVDARWLNVKEGAEITLNGGEHTLTSDKTALRVRDDGTVLVDNGAVLKSTHNSAAMGIESGTLTVDHGSKVDFSKSNTLVVGTSTGDNPGTAGHIVLDNGSTFIGGSNNAQLKSGSITLNGGSTMELCTDPSARNYRVTMGVSAGQSFDLGVYDGSSFVSSAEKLVANYYGGTTVNITVDGVGSTFTQTAQSSWGKNTTTYLLDSGTESDGVKYQHCNDVVLNITASNGGQFIIESDKTYIGYEHDKSIGYTNKEANFTIGGDGSAMSFKDLEVYAPEVNITNDGTFKASDITVYENAVVTHVGSGTLAADSLTVNGAMNFGSADGGRSQMVIANDATLANSKLTNANVNVGDTLTITKGEVTNTSLTGKDITITDSTYLHTTGTDTIKGDTVTIENSGVKVNGGTLYFGASDDKDGVVTLNGTAVENNGGTIHAYSKIEAEAGSSITATAGATHFHNEVEANGTAITAQGGAAMHFDEKVVLDGSKVTTLIDSSNSQGVIKFHGDVDASNGTVFEVIGGSGLTFEGNVTLNETKFIVNPGEKGYYNRNFSFLGDTVTATGTNQINGGITMGASTVLTASNGELYINANGGSSFSAPTSTLTNLQMGENGKINVTATLGYLKMTGNASITNLNLNGVWGSTISGKVNVAEKVTITDKGNDSLDITSTGSLKTSKFESTSGVITNSGSLTVNNSTTLTDSTLINQKGTTTLKGEVSAIKSDLVSTGGEINMSGAVVALDSTFYAHGGNINFRNEGKTLLAQGDSSFIVDKGVIRFGSQYNHNGLITSEGATFEAIKNSYSDNSVMYFHSAVDADKGTEISALGGTMYFERLLDVEGSTITSGKSDAGISGKIYLKDDVIAKDTDFIIDGGSDISFEGNVELKGGNTLAVKDGNSKYFTFAGEKVTVNGDNTISGGLTMGKNTVLTAESGVLTIESAPKIKENGSYNPQNLRLNNLQIAENAAEGTEINVTANRGQLSIGGNSTVNNLSIDRADTELSGNLNVDGMEIHATRNEYGVVGTVDFKGAEGTEANIGIMKVTLGTDGEMTHSGDGTVNVGHMLSDMPAPTVPESAINYEIKQTGNGTMNFDGWWATGASSIKMSQTGQGNININSVGANIDSMTQSGGGTVTVDSVAAHIGSLDVSEGSTFENLCSVTLNDVAISDATLFNAGSMSMDSLVMDNATLLFAVSSFDDASSMIQFNGADLTGYGTNNVSAADMIQSFGVVMSGEDAADLLQQWGSEVEFSFTLAKGSDLFEEHFAYVLDLNKDEFTITLGDVAELSFADGEIKNITVEDTENGVVVKGIAVIPEPTTATLSLLALAALAARRRRR